jgi:hypothetical protein
MDSIYAAAVTVLPGAGGAGVTWDFSSLTPVLEGTVTMISPSGAPNFSTFPTTTFCAKLLPTGGSPLYVYERLSATKWEHLANNYTGPGTGTDYTPNPESTLMFPMSYSNSFMDTFQKTTGGPNTVTVTYDGYGTLITPFTTYHNVVRIKKYWGVGDYAYNWLTTSPYLGIVAVFDAQNNAYTLVRQPGTTAIKEVAAQETAQLYPNPFTDKAILKINTAGGLYNASLIITDALGRVVKQVPVTGDETTLQRNGMSAGLYFYTVTNNSVKIASGKLIVQ